MITLRSVVVSRATALWSSPLKWSRTAVTPPTAIAISGGPRIRKAPTPYINRMAISVVNPGSTSPRRASISFPIRISPARARNPTATTHPPYHCASKALSAPSSVINEKVRSPASREATDSRCRPTRRPSPSAIPSFTYRWDIQPQRSLASALHAGLLLDCLPPFSILLPGIRAFEMVVRVLTDWL